MLPASAVPVNVGVVTLVRLSLLLAPLSAMLQDATSSFRRQQAAWVLSLYGPSAAAAVPALRPALKSDVADVRQRTAWVLGSIGPAARPALADLSALADHDPEQSIRLTAAQAVKQIDIENPFCITCSLFTGVNRGPNALRWTPLPSNNANAITSNTAVDLPFWKSRFVNTFQYNAMRQDDAFVNTGTNGVVMPPVMLGSVPVGSLNGKVDTFLWNGVYTGRPTHDLQLTIRGRRR